MEVFLLFVSVLNGFRSHEINTGKGSVQETRPNQPIQKVHAVLLAFTLMFSRVPYRTVHAVHCLLFYNEINSIILILIIQLLIKLLSL